MESRRREEGEEITEAGFLSSTESSSIEGSPKAEYVGEVDERFGAIAEETSAQRSMDAGTVMRVNSEVRPSPDIKPDSKHVDGDKIEVAGFREKANTENQIELDIRQSDVSSSENTSRDQEDLDLANILDEEDDDEKNLQILKPDVEKMPSFESRKLERNDSAKISGASVNEESLGLVENNEVGNERTSVYDDTQSDNLRLGSILDDDRNVVATFPGDGENNKTDSNFGAKVKCVETLKSSFYSEAGKEGRTYFNDDDNKNISLGSIFDEDCNGVVDYPIEVRNDKDNTKESKVDVIIGKDTVKQGVRRENYLCTAMELNVNDDNAVQFYTHPHIEDRNDKHENEDDIDLDELLGDSATRSCTEKNACNDVTKIKYEIQSSTHLFQEEVMGSENLEEKSLSPSISNDTEALNSNGLSDEIGTTILSRHNGSDNQILEEHQMNDGVEHRSSHELNVSVESADEVALELDALLDDSVSVEFEVIEELPSKTIPNIKNKRTTRTKTNDREVISKLSNSRRITQNSRNKLMGAGRERSPKKIVEDKSRISSSMSDKISSSKKKIITARDRMREYSREVSNRASNQLRKKKKNTSLGDDEKKSISPHLSSRAKRLFVTPMKNIPGTFNREGKEKRLNSPWGNQSNQKGIRHYMKSTICFTNKVSESQNIQEHKNTKKITGAPPNKIEANYSMEGKEKRLNHLSGKHSNQKGIRHYMKSTVCFTNKVLETQTIQEHKSKLKDIHAKKDMANSMNVSVKTNAGLHYKSYVRSYAGKSIGSLSSRCMSYYL